MEIVEEFPPVKFADGNPESNERNDAALAWMEIFAEQFGQLCKDIGIPLDVVEHYIEHYQVKIAKDLEVFKWAKSYSEHHDIGWEEAAKAVVEATKEMYGKIRTEVRNEIGALLGYRIVLVFPYVPTPESKPDGKPTVQEILIPAEVPTRHAESEQGSIAA